MDVFELRRKLIQDYGQYATSFVQIADDRIRARVDEELLGGLLWPEPLIQHLGGCRSFRESAMEYPPPMALRPEARWRLEVLRQTG